MKIAMLYASWEAFNEKWSTPIALKREFIRRGHDISAYNLYHDNGAMIPRKNTRTYSNQGLNQLYADTQQGYQPDVIFCLDYGPWDALHFDKVNFPNSKLVAETGDEPQSHPYHWHKKDRVHLLLSPDLPCTLHYRQHGANATWWTHHTDPSIFFPRPEVKVEFDCVTTCGPRGNGLTERIKSALGDRFSNERYFYGEEHAKRLNMGYIVFQCSQHKEVTRRIFEGMSCGKMVLTDRLPEYRGMNELFIENEDIVYYDSAEDAIAKINYYTENPQERDRIAKNGFDKVMEYHTVTRRVQDFETLVANL